jgi:hypothetical protein
VNIFPDLNSEIRIPLPRPEDVIWIGWEGRVAFMFDKCVSSWTPDVEDEMAVIGAEEGVFDATKFVTRMEWNPTSFLQEDALSVD